MTATAAPSPGAAGAAGSGGRARGVALVAVLAVLLVGGALVVGRGEDRNEEPLDPRSVAPTGARGLVLTLRELGAEVELLRTVPGPDVDAALVLVDRSDDDGRDALRDWVRDGGTLLVADLSSPLMPGAGGGCPSVLAELGPLELFGSRVDPGEGQGCYGGLVTLDDIGAGTVVGLRGPEPLLNEAVADGDGAVLAAAVLAPGDGARVAVVEAVGGGGDTALVDLLAPRAAQSIAQLVVAVVLYAAWRARRLGRPVEEPQPVQVAGSELVAATGRLLDARAQPGEAAEVLRADVRHQVERRLGLERGSPPDVLAAAVAGPSGLTPERAAAALGAASVTTEADLVAVATDLEAVRAGVLGR